MGNVLISGPAGAGKSAVAKERRDAASGPAVIADFQSIYAALSGDVRSPDGTFPLRDERLLPLTEYVRRAVITGAKAREIEIVATNSDGDPDRREFLLDELETGGIEADEIIIDPGEEVAKARLSSRRTGRLSSACKAATDRWYRRLGRRR